ncbi:hypothetical protein [Tahibacter amnicola]|uniref:Poly(3-hydroxybutyrate) depolymerase n=1 Tax=Tahibacter amnicola TaxID=2976241 RepID=A0ABY6BG49_9GAMM|nr:hypothetical protein [Tahibacter amnicola]UXI68739.1 hypothetical protein N4264_03545 [Tahibacter amnicola]
MRPRSIHLLLALFLAAPAPAATTVKLPPWACGTGDRILRSGFDGPEFVPSQPSGGSGSTGTGWQIRQYSLGGLGTGTQTVHLSIPPDYDPRIAWPLVIVLHGYAGTPVNADAYARSARNAWESATSAHRPIIAAPVANGPSGSWLNPPAAGYSDYDFLAAVAQDLPTAYNIDRARMYLWGFSAGGGVAHDLLVNGAVPELDENHLAAYSVGSARLYALACAGQSEAGCQNRLNTQARKLPLDIHLGTTDPMYGSPYFASQDPVRFQTAGWVAGDTLNYVTFNGGHTYGVTQVGETWSYLCRFAVTP